MSTGYCALSTLFYPMLLGIFSQAIEHQLRQIWLQMATEIAGDAIVVTEAQCPPPASPIVIGGQTAHWERFLLLASSDFSALVVRINVGEDVPPGVTESLPLVVPIVQLSSVLKRCAAAMV